MATITKTIKTSGGNYTSLSNWEAGEQTDLVSAGNIAVAECYSMDDTTFLEIDGWTTGVNNYIKITQAPGNTYTLKVTDVGCIIVYEEFVRMEKISVETVYVTLSKVCIQLANTIGTPNEIRLSQMYFKGHNNASQNQNGLVCNNSNINVKLYNNIFWNFNTLVNNNALIFYSANSVEFYNNTIIGGEVGAQISGTSFLFKNNIFYGNTYAIYDVSSVDSSSNNNSTGLSKVYAIEGKHANDRVNQTFSFTGVYHLASTDTGAKGFGITDPGAGLFSDDIDGNSRTVPWDIGADQYSSNTTQRRLRITITNS